MSLDLDELDEWVLVNNNGDAVVHYETWKQLIALARAGSRLADLMDWMHIAKPTVNGWKRFDEAVEEALAAFREAQGEMKP
jgi:hypothetical protein